VILVVGHQARCTDTQLLRRCYSSASSIHGKTLRVTVLPRSDWI